MEKALAWEGGSNRLKVKFVCLGGDSSPPKGLKKKKTLPSY